MNRSLSEWVPDPALLHEALTHSSYVSEHRGSAFNERLEFLGDAVVGLVVAEALYARHPDWDEGRLTRARARVVSQAGLVEAGRRLNLGAQLRLGKGEEQSGGRNKPSLLADAMEAVAGASFLAAGLPVARDLVLTALGDVLDSPETEAAQRDPKTSLAERLIKEGLEPTYTVVAESGPDHQKSFTVRVDAGPRRTAEGQGRSKRDAEQRAAEALLRSLGDQ
jgi:ribonuclease-3